MKLTEHARERMRQRHLSEEAVRLVCEHGRPNARGDRITLDVRTIDSLIDETRRALRVLEMPGGARPHVSSRPRRRREIYAHASKELSR